ncbi:MAG: tRNA (guanosine(46)-N7)-methyltransferase TrmB [Campylobacterota bacterium]
MPHLVVRSFEPSRLQEDSGYEWIAQDSDKENFFLINTGEFLIEVKKRQNDYVIKADKRTKPAQVEEIKKALLQLAKVLDLDILQQNTVPKNQKKASKYLKTITDFGEYSFDSAVNVEVGFGSGRHLLYQAKQNPQELFIGLEVHTASIEQVLKQLHLQNIENVFILNYDARLFLELLPSNSCKNIYVHFPVPWDKKPHRRVISQEFVQQSMRVLQKEGVLNLRTDSQNYFLYSFETFMGLDVCECKICKNLDIAVSSKYEDRWKKQKKNIYDFYVKSLDDTHKEQKHYSFDFTKSLQLSKVRYESFKFEQFFIRFERVFDIGGAKLLKLSFGSFNKPENRYIVVEKDRTYYLFQKPVSTYANFLAHQKLMEML